MVEVESASCREVMVRGDNGLPCLSSIFPERGDGEGDISGSGEALNCTMLGVSLRKEKKVL